MAQGCVPLVGVQPAPKHPHGVGTYSQTRSTGQSFLASFPGLALGERVQDPEVEGLGGSGGKGRLGRLGLGA